MITNHSIDLMRISEDCFALNDGRCKVMGGRQAEYCGTHRCPFYKPRNCKDWVRIEDRQGINLIPPEEAYGRRRR